jgi:hypothetical protein
MARGVWWLLLLVYMSFGNGSMGRGNGGMRARTMRNSTKVSADKREPMQEVVEPKGVVNYSIFQSQCRTYLDRPVTNNWPAVPPYLCCVYIRNTACVFCVCGFHHPMTYRA